MFASLLDNVSVVPVMNATAAGSGDTLKGTIVDCAGFDGVMFVCKLGDCDNTAVATLKAAIDDVNNTAGMGLLTGAGATVTATATSADNKLLIIDVSQPAQRYVEVQLARATANIAVDAIIAIKYKARSKPVTQATTVVGSFEYAPFTALAG